MSARELTAIMLFLSGPEGVRGSQTGACRAAGYAERSIHTTASRLFRKAKVRAFIEQHFLKLNVDAERTTLETALVSFADPAGVVDDAGEPLRLREMDPLVRRALKSFELDEEGRVVSAHFHNKVESLRLLADLQGLRRFGIDVHHKLPFDLIAQVRDRVQGGHQPQEVTDGHDGQSTAAGAPGAGGEPAGLLPPGHPGLRSGGGDGAGDGEEVPGGPGEAG